MKKRRGIALLTFLSFLLILAIISCTSNYFNLLNVPIRQIDNQNYSENFGFAFSSDPHLFSKNSNYSATIKILQLIEKYYNYGKIKAFFILGDYFDNGGKKENWYKYNEIVKQYAPKVPILSVIGNHDKYFGGDNYWRQFFNYKNIKNIILGLTDFIWYYKYNNFHFIGLNLPWNSFNMNEKEKKWVKEITENVPENQFLIVLSNSFFYSSGYKGLFYNWFDNKQNIEKIAPLFIKKAKLVISGYNHYMEWIEKEDIY